MDQPTSTGIDPEIRIERQSLHDAILNRLRDMIIEGQLPPGIRMNEGQLGTMLGVSRTPLREAIKFLASEGLVELVPSRGAVVKSFGAKEVRDMLEVLRMIEQQAGIKACEIASDADIAKIRVLHDDMVQQYQRKDRLAYYKLNQAIHTAVVALADNAALNDIHARLQMRLKRVRFIGHEGPEKWNMAITEHEEIMNALESRSPERVSAILGKHLSLAWVRVRDSLEDQTNLG